MAEFLAVGGWAAPGSVGVYLRQALPDDYTVVADPVVWRHSFDAVVVGPDGITILDAADRPATDGREAIQCLRQFMADEFPKLAPPIRHCRALPSIEDDFPVWKAVEAAGMKPEPLAETITGESAGAPQWASQDTREAVALALRDHMLTASQRATKPFQFRGGKKVWTIREAVHYMDGHPADGIHHLGNGTLAAWLADEGAGHLAELARESVLVTKTDQRAALETFLLGTGLVQAARLWTWPRVVDLGYLLEGESGARVLRLRKGRGRGYLFGELSVVEPWLSVEPLSFRGGPVEAVVSAATDTLAISPQPYHAEVHVSLYGAEEPTAAPVRLRVVALPSGLSRRLLRPMAGLTLAFLVGAVLGLLWELAGIHVPGALSSFRPLGFTSPWGALVGLVWAIFGLIRGIRQPPAWPTGYAAGRWLARALGWAAFLGGLTASVLWVWRQGFGGNVALSDISLWKAGLMGAALAAVPASLSETVSAQQAAHPRVVKGRRSWRRTIVAGLLAIALFLLVLSAPRTVVPAWQSVSAHVSFVSADDWIQTGWGKLNDAANAALEQVSVRYYDRRAPIGPTVAPPTPRPTGEQAPETPSP